MPFSPDSRVLVTGAGAQLGGAILTRLAGACRLEGLTRQQLDVTSSTAVEAAVRDLSPDVVVNCASYNDVDGAERDAVAALEINGLAVGHLADACTRHGARLVHYSTDFVFDPAEDPGLLVELCRKVIDELDSGACDSGVVEREAQLREIAKTIERLEKAQWVRYQMTQDGTLRADSPYGIWVLMESPR